MRRSEILRKKADFDYLKTGAIISKLKHFTCVLKKSPDLQTKVAFIVSKKKFPQAVDRNRARRIMKEAFRKKKNLFSNPVYILFIANRAISDKKPCDLESDIELITQENK